LEETLYQFGLKEMHGAVSSLLQLSRLTKGFRHVPEAFFDFEFPSYRLLIDGKDVDPTGTPSLDHKNWHESKMDFCPELAVRATLLDKLHQKAVDIIGFVLEQTEDFSKVPAKWIFENPHTLPILISALGPLSKRAFSDKHKLSNASDRGVSQKDAEKIARLFMHSDVETRERIEGNMRSTNEGIVRDLIGKVLFESLVNQAIEDAGITCVREAENRPMEGLYASARPDFAFPCPEEPKAFIEVRKATAAHSTLYASDKCWMVSNWKAKHPGLVGIFLYAGSWSRPALDALRAVYDYVIPVSESEYAARLIRSHVDGDPSVQKRRVHFQIETLNEAAQ
jgi:hypothetical protein